MGVPQSGNMSRAQLSAISLLAITATALNVPLATWNGNKGTAFDFKELNDPVMGGQSSGTFTVDTAGKFGIFEGVVKDVPSLKAPGFIKTSADGAFPDASAALDGDLVLSVRSTTPEYQGF